MVKRRVVHKTNFQILVSMKLYWKTVERKTFSSISLGSSGQEPVNWRTILIKEREKNIYVSIVMSNLLNTQK